MLSRRDGNELISTFLALPGFKDQNLQEREFIVHFLPPGVAKELRRRGRREQRGKKIP